MLVTCNGIRVLSGQIVMPRVGDWTGDALLDGAAPTGAVEIVVGGEVTFAGTAYRPRDDRERHGVKVVGGAGGLATALRPIQHRGCPLRIPLEAILAEAGEALSSTADDAILTRSLTGWARRGGAAGAAIAELLRDTGAVWRVLDDGTVWAGTETWPEVVLQATALDEPVTEDWADFAFDTPTLRPGTTFRGRRVSDVVHTFEPDRVRTRVYFEQGTGRTVDRMKSALFGLVRHATADVDYHPSYAATVVTQQGNGDLQVRTDDPRFGTTTNDGRGLAGVKRWPGVPGFSYLLSKGARVLVGFLDGRPKTPIVTGWLSGLPTLVNLNATRIELGESPTRGVARDEDTVDVGTLILSDNPNPPGPQGVIATYTPGGGGTPQTGLILGTISVGTPITFALSGVITSASSKSFAE